MKSHSKVRRKLALTYIYILTREYHETNTVLTISQPKTSEFRAKAEFTAHGHSEQMGGTTSHSLWSVGIRDFGNLNIPPETVILSLVAKLSKRTESKLPTAEEHPF